MTLLEKPLGDLRRELIDLRQRKFNYDYDINKLGFIITISRNSLRETEVYQQKLFEQLQQFEISLADINEILRINVQEKVQLERQLNDENDMEIRAKLMSLNAEALECRAAAVQLQQDAKIALAKAAEIEKRASDELVQQALEMKLKQQEIERNRAEELERRVRLEEERQRLKELEIQQQQQQQQKEQERLLSMPKIIDEYIDWPVQDFIHDDQCPPCLVRTAPNALVEQININYLPVIQTEHLLDNQEELISTPLQIEFETKKNNGQFILLSIPFIVRRLPHRENVIKIRQSNGIWISIETNESSFDSHRDKRFVECKLTESACCAVVSRLKREQIHINQQYSNRFVSTADSRVTVQWPNHICEKDVQLNLRIQPVDLPSFTQFSSIYSHECQGLLAVGPIINFDFEEINFLKPIQLTLPMLVQGKKNDSIIKSTNITSTTPNTPLSQQELILQQQQSIFKSLLGEDSTTERLALLYASPNENNWQMDANVRLIDSKTHDLITMQTKSLHPRMILVRYDKQMISSKQLSNLIPLLEQSLSQRTVCFILRHNRTNPNEICFVCCSNHRLEQIEQNLDEENFTRTNEQVKELVLHEGQLLELRFRGNVLPTDNPEKTYSFAFNTFFPYYFQGNITEIDKYAQHFAAFFYGFTQIYSKQKVLRTISKETEKKKQQQQPEIKQEWYETDVCLLELVLRLAKSSEETRVSTPKTLPTFVSEGILTPTLIHDIATSLNGDEWRRLARRLGLTRMRIEAIERDFTEETAYHMLITWFKRVPRSTDKVALLIHGLTNINRWDLVNDLQNMKEEKRQEMKLSSKDEQLRLFQIAFNRICQREECVRMWKQLARELSLTNQDIDRIERDYSSKHERCLRSLEQWLNNDNRAEIIVLVKIIRSLGFKSLANEINSLA